VVLFCNHNSFFITHRFDLMEIPGSKDVSLAA
jgi:hypothetical protein